MTTAAEQARADLIAALQVVDGVRYYDDLGGTVEPPGTIVGPPELTWEAHCSEPTMARFVVLMLVGADERAITQMLALLPAVVAAIESVRDAVVTAATPTAASAGATDLPCYAVTVEVAL